jgi:hypothetical protein
MDGPYICLQIVIANNPLESWVYHETIVSTHLKNQRANLSHQIFVKSEVGPQLKNLLSGHVKHETRLFQTVNLVNLSRRLRIFNDGF